MKPKSPASGVLKLSLYANAVDFAEDALSNAIAADQMPIRWKFAILSMVQSIELSLKELLRMQHPALIYTNIDASGANDKESQTVTLAAARKRLERWAGIKLTEDENKALKTASDFRNQIVHFQVKQDVRVLKAAFSHLLGFLNDFHRSHFDVPLQEAISSRLWTSGVKIQDYGKELFRRARLQIETDQALVGAEIFDCPHCGWQALPAVGEGQCCLVCNAFEGFITCERCTRIVIYADHAGYDERHCLPCYEYLSDYGDYLDHVARDDRN